MKNKKNKSKKLPKLDVNTKKRLTVFLGMSIVIFVALTFRISWIQFAPTVWGHDLQERAYRQQIATRTLTPRRGNLFDVNGRRLASSIELETVLVNPTRLRASDRSEIDRMEIARGFSYILELDYEEVYEIYEMLNSDSESVRIATGITHDRVTKLREWIGEERLLGITFAPDSRRIYPYHNIASNLIGFTRTDGHGAVGLEHSLDRLLAGRMR